MGGADYGVARSNGLLSLVPGPYSTVVVLVHPGRRSEKYRFHTKVRRTQE